MPEDKQSTAILNDGREMLLRWLGPDDKDLVLDFTRDLDDDEIRYLNQDLKDHEVMSSWLDQLGTDRYRLVAALDAEAGGRMAGYAYFFRGAFSGAHRADVEAFIHPAYRDLGLGSRLLREAADLATAMGILLLKAEMYVGRADLIKSFKRLDYELKAILEDFRLDREGHPYDAIIMMKRLVYQGNKEFLYRY